MAVAKLDPPFTTSGQAIAFVGFTGLALLLPLILFLLQAPRRHIYTALPTAAGNSSFIEREIFERRGGIDVLFVGSSPSWAGVDAPEVAQLLTKTTGRNASVVSLGTQFWGAEPSYFVLRDLLENRSVRFVALQTPIVGPVPDEVPNRWAFRYLTLGGQVRHSRAQTLNVLRDYAAMTLGAPRHLLSLIRQDRLEKSTENGGALLWREGFALTPASRPAPFVEFVPRSLVDTTVVIAAHDTSHLARRGFPVDSYHLDYLRATIELLRSHRIPFVLLSFPTYYTRRDSLVVERVDWSSVAGPSVAIVGIPPATLFRGLPDDDIRRLFYNPFHLNANGATFYTRAIFPSLVAEYTRATAP